MSDFVVANYTRIILLGIIGLFAAWKYFEFRKQRQPNFIRAMMISSGVVIRHDTTYDDKGQFTYGTGTYFVLEDHIVRSGWLRIPVCYYEVGSNGQPIEMHSEKHKGDMSSVDYHAALHSKVVIDVISILKKMRFTEEQRLLLLLGGMAIVGVAVYYAIHRDMQTTQALLNQLLANIPAQ